MRIRIIGGEHKGQYLDMFSKNLPIRPMTQRVKKSVFDTIQSCFSSEKPVRVLDLFSGCGNLSFEALSRGAIHADAVEKNKKCVEVIRNNARKLGLNQRIDIHLSDVFSYLKTFKNPEPYSIIFIDPPFREFLSESIINHLKTSSVCDSNTLIVLELSSKEKLKEDASINLKSVKEYGDKHVYFFYILES